MSVSVSGVCVSVGCECGVCVCLLYVATCVWYSIVFGFLHLCRHKMVSMPQLRLTVTRIVRPLKMYKYRKIQKMKM